MKNRLLIELLWKFSGDADVFPSIIKFDDGDYSCRIMINDGKEEFIIENRKLDGVDNYSVEQIVKKL